MSKEEFEKLAGYEVSVQDYYDIIEPMYMATDLIKEEFVKVIDKQRFALKTKQEYIEEMQEIAKQLKDTCDKYTDYEKTDKLNLLLAEYKERFNIYGYTINTKNTLANSRGCSYPADIVFYNNKYSTIEKIELFK